MKLLIVDDAESARETIRSFVGHLADEIHTCESGYAAAAHCKVYAPDVMTLDLRMSDNGILVLEYVRDHCPQIHVLVVTQFVDSAIQKRVMQLGAARCFAKSEMVELRAYLEQYVAARAVT